MNSKKIVGSSVTEWKIAGVIGVFGFFLLIYLIAGGPSSAPKELPKKSDAEKKHEENMAAMNNSFGLCRKAIQTISRDPEKSEIPYMFPVVDENGDWAWIWNQQTKLLRLRNGLGLDVAATGQCNVNREKMRIAMLIVDGKIILAPEEK